MYLCVAERRNFTIKMTHRRAAQIRCATSPRVKITPFHIRPQELCGVVFEELEVRLPQREAGDDHLLDEHFQGRHGRGTSGVGLHVRRAEEAAVALLLDHLCSELEGRREGRRGEGRFNDVGV